MCCSVICCHTVGPTHNENFRLNVYTKFKPISSICITVTQTDTFRIAVLPINILVVLVTIMNTQGLCLVRFRRKWMTILYVIMLNVLIFSWLGYWPSHVPFYFFFFNILMCHVSPTPVKSLKVFVSLCTCISFLVLRSSSCAFCAPVFVPWGFLVCPKFLYFVTLDFGVFLDNDVSTCQPLVSCIWVFWDKLQQACILYNVIGLVVARD